MHKQENLFSGIAIMLNICYNIYTTYITERYFGQYARNVSMRYGLRGCPLNDTSYTDAPDRPLVSTQENGYIFADDCLYYYGDHTIHRYDIRTGLRTNLCEDPLCTHTDAACVLGNCDEYFYFDGFWTFSKLPVGD